MEKNVFNFVHAKMKVGLAEGVDPNKFAANSAIAVNPEMIKKVFESYGYDLSEVQGSFIKCYTMSPKELEEVNTNLKEIEEKGLHALFQANLGSGIRCFRSTFMKRLEQCRNESRPFLNPDNTFAAFLLQNNMEQMTQVASPNVIEVDFSNAPMNNEVREEDTEAMEQKLGQMNAEDRQVYNEIIQRLNYLVLANPMDVSLVSVVSNATNKVVDAILRGEYKYIGLEEMVGSIMFEGLEITPEDNARITELISGAFQEEERKLA